MSAATHPLPAPNRDTLAAMRAWADLSRALLDDAPDAGPGIRSFIIAAATHPAADRPFLDFIASVVDAMADTAARSGLLQRAAANHRAAQLLRQHAAAR